MSLSKFQNHVITKTLSILLLELLNVITVTQQFQMLPRRGVSCDWNATEKRPSNWEIMHGLFHFGNAVCALPTSKPLSCLRIDFRMVRINEILCMYHNLMLIHNLMSLSCTDYNYNIFRVLEFRTAVLRITHICLLIWQIKMLACLQSRHIGWLDKIDQT